MKELNDSIKELNDLMKTGYQGGYDDGYHHGFMDCKIAILKMIRWGVDLSSAKSSSDQFVQHFINCIEKIEKL